MFKLNTFKKLSYIFHLFNLSIYFLELLMYDCIINKKRRELWLILLFQSALFVQSN